MRLIDADALLAKPLFESHQWHFININYVKNAPTVQEERSRGNWNRGITLSDGNLYRCSNCGFEMIFSSGTPAKYNYNYCPNCGAKMDLED